MTNTTANIRTIRSGEFVIIQSDITGFDMTASRVSGATISTLKYEGTPITMGRCSDHKECGRAWAWNSKEAKLYEMWTCPACGAQLNQTTTLYKGWFHLLLDGMAKAFVENTAQLGSNIIPGQLI